MKKFLTLGIASLAFGLAACGGGGEGGEAKSAAKAGCDQAGLTEKATAVSNKIQELASTDPQKLMEATEELQKLSEEFSGDEIDYKKACAAYDKFLEDLG